jgi:hypothetical protein
MKKLLKIVLITPLVLFLIIVCLNFYSVHFDIPTVDEKGAWTSESPDGRFRVTGYSRSSLFDMGVMMPGQGGIRGRGIIILWDNKTGRILQQERVDSIIAHDHVDWIGNYVHIDFISPPWPLPLVDGSLPPSWDEYVGQEIREFDMKNSALKKSP